MNHKKFPMGYIIVPVQKLKQMVFLKNHSVSFKLRGLIHKAVQQS